MCTMSARLIAILMTTRSFVILLFFWFLIMIFVSVYLSNFISYSYRLSKWSTFASVQLSDKVWIFLVNVLFIVQMVFESSGFNELSEDTLCTILRSDSLLLDEIDIYHAVHKWADVQSVSISRKQKGFMLIFTSHFVYFTKAFLLCMYFMLVTYIYTLLLVYATFNTVVCG